MHITIISITVDIIYVHLRCIMDLVSHALFCSLLLLILDGLCVQGAHRHA